MNRLPVLTLWAAAVAEVFGFEHDEALTLYSVSGNGNKVLKRSLDARNDMASQFNT